MPIIKNTNIDIIAIMLRPIAKPPQKGAVTQNQDQFIAPVNFKPTNNIPNKLVVLKLLIITFCLLILFNFFVSVVQPLGLDF